MFVNFNNATHKFLFLAQQGARPLSCVRFGSSNMGVQPYVCVAFVPLRRPARSPHVAAELGRHSFVGIFVAVIRNVHFINIHPHFLCSLFYIPPSRLCHSSPVHSLPRAAPQNYLILPRSNRSRLDQRLRGCPLLSSPRIQVAHRDRYFWLLSTI
jgi:hypothetical protein